MSAAVIGGQFLMAAATHFTIARLMGVEEYGTFAGRLAVVLMAAPLVSLGQPTAALHLVARARATDDLTRISQFLRVGTATAIVLSIPLAAALVLLGSRLSFLEVGSIAAVLVAVAVAVRASLQLATEVYRSVGDASRSRIYIGVVSPGLFLVTTVGLWQLDALHPDTAIAAYAAADALTWFFVRRRLSQVLPPAPRRLMSKGWSEPLRSGPSIALAKAVQQGTAQFPIILVGWFAGAEAAGGYAVSAKGAAMVGLGLAAINQVAGPARAREYADGDMRTFRAGYRRTAAAAAGISLVPSALLVLFAPELLRVLGPGFASTDTVLALRVLVGAQFLGASFGPTGLLLHAMGYHFWALMTHLGQLATLVAGAFVARSLGSVGVALAFLASTIAWNASAAWLVLKKSAPERTN